MIENFIHIRKGAKIIGVFLFFIVLFPSNHLLPQTARAPAGLPHSLAGPTLALAPLLARPSAKHFLFQIAAAKPSLSAKQNGRFPTIKTTPTAEMEMASAPAKPTRRFC
jgi:hypothetical protein